MMLLRATFVLAALAFSAQARPLVARDASDADIERLAPNLGFQSGVNPTGTGDCDGAVKGANGQPIKIPCACPPNQNDFVQALKVNVHAGKAVNNPSVGIDFPTDDSKDSQLARINAAAVTLQNLNGSGKGCPFVSTTLGAQADAIRNGNAPPPPQANTAPPPPPAAGPATVTVTVTAQAPAATCDQPQQAPPPPQPNTQPAGGAGGDDIDRLAPDLGFQSGVNPTGTGDCDGAVNGPDGKPIKIPCACPPARDVFLAALRENVQAGHAVKNPSVSLSFPTGDSKDDKNARITASLITIQNLNGPGQGCPAVSTTLLAQQKAL